MKREGRQHGVVRTYPILSAPFSQQRHVKTVDSASVTGLFTKVSRKPTNHSKFTGKCGKSGCAGCHIHPACKSKDKGKGTMKLRSIESDSGVNGYQVNTSATSVLAYLANDSSYDDKEEYNGAINEYDYGYESKCKVEYGIGLASAVTNKQENEDECMSYCDVGLCWGDGDGDADVYGDDGWYLVGHTQ